MTLDWTNPTIQGAVVAAAISLIGVSLAGAAGIVGAIAGARIGASAMTREGERIRLDAAATRVREWNIRRVEDTRTQLVAIADGFLALMEKDLATGRAQFAQMNVPLLANARLVGDIDALAALARAVVSTASVVEGHRLFRAIRLAVTNPFHDEHRGAMRDARAAVLNALERQQERALRDQPLIELTPDEIASIPEFARASVTVDEVRNEQAE